MRELIIKCAHPITLVNKMKYYFKDVVFTLLVKGILLYLLWFFCVKHTPSYWQNGQEWMLSHHFQTNSSPQETFSQQTKGVTDDKQHSR